MGFVRPSEEEYQEYRERGLQGICPARPGPEREAWHLRRAWLACRALSDAFASGNGPEIHKRLAGMRGALMDPGRAAQLSAFTKALDALAESAAKADLYEDGMTRFYAEAQGLWGTTRVAARASVDFPARMRKEE